MRERGPSPLVPSLLVIALVVLIGWPSLLSIWEAIVPLFQLGSCLAIIAIVLLLLLHLISFFYPTLDPLMSSASSSAPSSAYTDSDGVGFGIGYLLLLLLFVVLYKMF